MYNPDGPSPLLLSWMGKRVLVFSEVPEGTLDMDLIKHLTDMMGTKTGGRQLYSGRYDYFHPTWGMFACSNFAPSVRVTQGAAAKGSKRRMKMLSTTIEFVSDPNPLNPNQRLKDSRIKQAIFNGDYSHDLFWICALAVQTLDHTVCPGDEIEPIPPRVLEETNNLFPAADPIREWLVSTYTYCPRAEGVKWQELATNAFNTLGYEFSWRQVGDAKTSLQAVGVSTVNLYGRQVAIFAHPENEGGAMLGLRLKA